MNINLKIEKTSNVKYLKAKVGARYWEDTTVNGQEDTEGTLIPCREDDYWCPLIDVETGIITNWQKGTTASVHYKCCDDGEYALLDENMNEIVSIDGYVPDIMCPEGDGYGDYVIMEIDENGKIAKFKPNFDDFTEE